MFFKTRYPFVTFIIPTLNAERYLKKCLKSISKQNYPKNKYEVLIIDGGSKDKTKEIVNEFGYFFIDNPMVDQESGKAIGIKKSKGQIVALLDSDNEIVKKDWLKKMVYPLTKNPHLFGVESEYFYQKKDSIYNKYCMSIHIADPFSRMLAAKLNKKKKQSFIECTIPKGQSYPLGANGFLWNKMVISKIGVKGLKFEESNFSYYAMEKGFRSFARVPGYGIYHRHIHSLGDFVKKRLKIGNKFLNRKVEKKKTWLEGVPDSKFVLSLIYCLTFVGPSLEGIYNAIMTKRIEWLLHPMMSFLSVITYGYVFIKRKINV